MQPLGRNPYHDYRNWRDTIVKEQEYVMNRSLNPPVWPPPETPAGRPFCIPTPGEQVVVRGLRSKSEHNGAQCEVITAPDAEGFVTVQVLGQAAVVDGTIERRRLKVRLDKLQPLGGAASSPAIGGTPLVPAGGWPVSRGRSSCASFRSSSCATSSVRSLSRVPSTVARSERRLSPAISASALGTLSSSG
mmetsp:Transcript_55105/g.139158  ORF Transcript_55105/g.139158 Transcript_55105/m.139158 type:complete len:190 (-) Transcript_55105:39-608(-)